MQVGDAVKASFAAREPAGLVLTSPLDVAVVGPQLCVSAQGEVKHVFAAGIPGAARVTSVRARSGATLAGQSLGAMPRSSCA